MTAAWRFHHIGVLVHDIDRACVELARLGYTRCGERRVDPVQGVDFVIVGGRPAWPLLELIQPHRGDSVVSDLLQRTGATPYHLCFEVGNIKEALRDCHESGYTPCGEPSASPLFDGRLAAFVYHTDLGLIEFLQQPGGVAVAS